MRRAAGVAAVLVLLASRAARAQEAAPPVPPPPAPAPFETVVTAAPPAPREPREDHAAASTVVLPGDSPRAFDELWQMLDDVPGVVVTRSGSLGATGTLSLRGSNPDEVRVYLDGVPLNVAEGGGVDISTLPLGDVERVEVYRGSTPLAFGESALGGIVSITTRTPGTPELKVRAGGGSFGTMFADATGGGRVGRLRLYVGLHGLMVGNEYGYANDMGTAINPSTPAVRVNDDARQADGVLRAALDLPGRRSLGLGVIGFGRDQGLPGPGAFPTTYARFRTARGLGSLRYESRDDLGPGGRLTAAVFAEAERDNLHDPYGELGSSPRLTHDTTLSAGATAHASKPLASWLGVAAILEGRREAFQPVDDAVAMPEAIPASRLFGAAGAELDLWWPRADLEVIPSVRLESARDVATSRVVLTEPAPAAGSIVVHTEPVLRLGLVRPLGSAVTAKANLGRYTRLPSLLELYGETGRLLGNPSLRPERGDTADLGVTVDARAGRLQLHSITTAFAAHVDDLIQWAPTPGGAEAENDSSTRVLGVEQELRLEAGRHGRLTAQATYTDAVDTGPSAAHHGHQLPLHPRWHLYGRPELVALPVRGGGARLGLFADADFRAGDYNDPSSIAPPETRLLIGAGASVEVPRWGMRLTASGQNLTGSTAPDIKTWPLPGRSVFVSLAWMGGPDRKQESRSD
jgi:iron complex outermembrane receptor protein